MWKLAPTDLYHRRHKEFQKKRPRELKAALLNLATYVEALEAGAKPLQIKFGFIHPEPHGVVAVDQKGGGANLSQTRLYVYADTDEHVLYQITLGDKRSQKEDIARCNEFVAELRKAKAMIDENVQPPTEEFEGEDPLQ